MSDIRNIYQFTTYLEGFKKMERFRGQKYWRDYPKPNHYESNADHTWRMAMILMLIDARLSQPFDFKRAMKMLLVHDIPEMKAGDPSPFGESGNGSDAHAFNKSKSDEKFEREKVAAKSIFAMLPKQEAHEMLDLWLEFEAQETFEAKVVKAIDKFEAKLQVFEYTNGVVYKEHFDFNMVYGVDAAETDPVLKELWEILMGEMKDRYVEFVPQSAIQNLI